MHALGDRIGKLVQNLYCIKLDQYLYNNAALLIKQTVILDLFVRCSGPFRTF